MSWRLVRRWGCVALMVGLAAVAPVAGASLAGASGSGDLRIDVEGDGVGMGGDPGPVLRGLPLPPGGVRSGRVDVLAGVVGELRVRATGVRDDDNGCDEPERLAGDRTCGTGEGELARIAVVSLRRAQSTWTGTVEQLSRAGADLGRLAPGDVTPIEVELRIPRVIGNDAQGDSVTFGFAFSLTAPAVVADRTTNGAVLGHVLPDALPFTGLPVLTLVLLGLGLVAVSLAALAAGRRRVAHRAARS
jgi:hypothetical protein